MDKKRIIIRTVMFVCVAIVLAISFKAGENVSDTSAPVPPPKPTVESIREERGEELLAAPKESDASSSEESSSDKPSEKDSTTDSLAAVSEETDKTANGNKTEVKPNAVFEKNDAAKPASKTSELTCSISVDCGDALKSDKLAPEKAAHLPKNGIVYASENAAFKDGETVFDVLKRELTHNKIHMEFSGNSGYGSMYIEGINNLYEYDCGELSGWTYKVNGEFPKVGCSKYVLKQGDKVEWLYSCDLGGDF